MTNIDDEFGYRETTMIGGDGEIHHVVVRLERPRSMPSMPPLPKVERCTRGCPDGECYCAEPMISDFMFPDGDGNGWEGDYE